MILRNLAAAVLAVVFSAPLTQGQNPCRASESSVRVALPAHPYAALAMDDGCTIFVTTQNTPNPGGISVITFADGKFSLKHSLALSIQPAGLRLTHDGRLLIAPGVDGVAFVDVAALLAGKSDAVLATLDDGGKGPIAASVTADDKILFVSDERSNTVTVIDLVKARENGFKADSIIGRIPTATQPVGLAISPDQRFLYIAAEVAIKTDPAINTCRESRRGGPEDATIAQGIFAVVDIAKGKTASPDSIVAEHAAGCRPVRVALTRNGERAYIAARASNEIVAFDTAKAQRNDRGARLGSVTLPSSAIGIALTSDGRTLFASNGQTVTIIDTASIGRGNTAIKGTIPSSGAGRELFLTPDNQILLLTNNAANLLEIIDLSRLRN